MNLDLQALIESVIFEQMTEGGLAGHMSHLYENPDLTFGDLKNVFRLASQGKLQEVTEKLDGQNFFFTFVLTKGEVRFARNKGNIKSGGLSAADVAAKWADKPAVSKAFTMAYKIMQNAIGTLDPETTKSIFGPNGNIWYSAEVLSTDNPNTINYDRNVLVFHKSGVVYDQNGNPTEVDTSQNFNLLVSQVERLQKAVADSGWNIMGPILVPLQKLANQEPLKKATTKLQALQSQHGLSDNHKIRDFLKATIIKGSLSRLDSDLIKFMADLIVDNNMSGNEKRKILQSKVSDKTTFKTLVDLLMNRNQLLSGAIVPIEMIVHDFAVDLLSGVQSMIALHPNEEVRRLKSATDDAIQKIKQSGNREFIDTLNKQLSKLQSVDRVTSSMEGITFRFKGHTYKFTGAFNPINQILGLVRYGRGGTKI